MLSAGGSGNVGRDRLVVTLQPLLTNDNGSMEHLKEVRGGVVNSGRHNETRRKDESDDHNQRAGNDERPRHALVVSCAPGQVRRFGAEKAEEKRTPLLRSLYTLSSSHGR